jgi:hypothetical protein
MESCSSSIIDAISNNDEIFIFDCRNNSIGIHYLFSIHQLLERNEMKSLRKRYNGSENVSYSLEFKWLDLDPIKTTYHYINQKTCHRMHTEASLKKMKRNVHGTTFQKQIKTSVMNKHEYLQQISNSMQALDAINSKVVMINTTESKPLESCKTNKFKKKEAWGYNGFSRKSNHIDKNCGNRNVSANIVYKNKPVLNTNENFIDHNLNINQKLNIEITEDPSKMDHLKLLNDNKMLHNRLEQIEAKMNNLQHLKQDGSINQILDLVEMSLKEFGFLLDKRNESIAKSEKVKRNKNKY